MWELKDFTEIRRWYALHLVLCFTFFISSLMINFVQILLFLTLRPLSKSIYRQINYYLFYSLASQILFIAEWWSGTDMKIYSNEDSFQKWGKEKALIVMNHSYELDWLMGWIVGDRCRMLAACKVFVKNMMRYVPTIGWAWTCSDVIFVKRNWEEDKKHFKQQISEFFDYPYPVWVLLFCEGTRFTNEKHEASMEFAKQRGIQPLKHLLIPRTRGFVHCADAVKGQFSAVYDVTLAFNRDEGTPEPTFVNMLRGQKMVADVYITRIPMEEVPSEPEAAAEYIHELYRKKDKMLDSYFQTGSFSKLSGVPELELCYLPRRYPSLFNAVGWAVVVMTMLMYQFYGLLISGSIMPIIVAVFVVLLAYYGLHKLIGLTRIKSSSSYGNGNIKNK